MVLKQLYNKDIKIFEPWILTEKDFAGINIDSDIIAKAVLGSQFWKKRFDDRMLFPEQNCIFTDISPEDDLLIHDYTGKCPVQTFEINPVKGCNVGCAYCLVNDGIHEKQLLVYQNYQKLVENKLKEYMHEEHYFYFSPKTEAFCEATLQTGVAHNILRVFIEHFLKYPGSKVRIFIASKAGIEALQYRHNGESVLDLFKLLKDKMQFNTSLSIFPPEAIQYIEPWSAPLQSRFDAVALCRENGIMANSALVQPIIISILNDDVLDNFFSCLSKIGIVNFKPEFLTACVENMVLMAQILQMYDADIFKKLFELYFSTENLDHKKQRGRTAPLRNQSLLWINKMITTAEKYGISISICNWVREQLNIKEDKIPLINKNGFKCLGYQTQLF